MISAEFDYVRAQTLDEALTLLGQNEDAKILAGGHSLIPAMKLRLQSPQTLIDLGTVPGLRGVSLDGNSLVTGALTVSARASGTVGAPSYMTQVAPAASGP